MSISSPLETIFEQAAKRLPPSIELCDTEGSFEPDDDGNVEFEQGLSATVGRFLDVDIYAFGYLRLELHEGDLEISAGFAIVADRGGIRNEVYGHHVLLMHYDVESKCWGEPYLC